MAKTILKRHKPRIVAITGSVGKTSAKTAIFEVLSSKFSVRENQKNYNNEIGIPLTIIGAESGERNILRWLWVFLKWLWTLVYPFYPEILVLELGVDRPGDMAYFMSFIHPYIGVVTNVSSSHLEYFSTLEKIAKEKGVLIKSLKASSFAVLNIDDELTFQMKDSTKAQIMTFGLDQDAQINASNSSYNYHQSGRPDGISFKLNYDGKNIPIRLKHILGQHYVYPALTAVASGLVFKMNLVEIAQALENFKAPVGRMNLLSGKNNSHIIDDTYNASPESTLAALETLSQLKSERKIAVLGDMLELGQQSHASHREIGKKIFQSKIDLVVLMGERMNDAHRELISHSFPADRIMRFMGHKNAINFLEKTLKKGDFVLVKGSQGMRMEKVVEGILADPKQAKNLLCRQAKQWKNKPYMKP